MLQRNRRRRNWTIQRERQIDKSKYRHTKIQRESKGGEKQREGGWEIEFTVT